LIQDGLRDYNLFHFGMKAATMDRLEAIRLFIRVVESGSFSAAARAAGISQSAASKHIAALEAKLGAQLLLRSSRSLAVTEAGQTFYDGAIRLTEDFAALEALLHGNASGPSGLIRVAVAPVFGRLYVVPRLPKFFELYTGIRVEMLASERIVNLIEDGIDLAIRHGDLADSSLTARRLATNSFVTVATPHYLERHGTPAEPSDLNKHNCIAFSTQWEVRPWLFAMHDGAKVQHQPEGRFRTGDGEQLRAAVLEHLGIAHVPAWLVTPELASGALRAILHKHETEELAISAVFPGRRLAAKARVLIDFLARTLPHDLSLAAP
jgi:DNA-binding transcriptional LysR family regulator